MEFDREFISTLARNRSARLRGCEIQARIRFAVRREQWLPLLASVSMGIALLCAPALSVVSSKEDPASAGSRQDFASGHSATSGQRSITVDYPEEGSIFPPEITPPTFLWRDADSSARSWRIDVSFGDGSRAIHTVSQGPPMQIGPIDPRCVSTSNKLPTLTPEQAAAHAWKPETDTWEFIKEHSVKRPAIVAFTGLDESGRAVGHGQVTLTTSRDPVGAPIFYRDVPLMPSEGAKHVVQPLAPSAISLINWRMRDISKPDSRIVMHDVHSCANCHSFSADGKTMGLDMDGPGNDKGLYAVVRVQKQMTIRNKDMITWNQDMRVGRSRVGFMSQISPDGRYVLTTFAGLDRDISDSYFVTNFKDYRFLQVFYPTRGILTWYDRTTGVRAPLPGADDPKYVQTDGVWSPDGKFIVFARAEARDPHPAQPLPLAANDPNEVQIQYNLYRVPFNDGKGGVAVPIAGASDNGMSNNFPKVSPDGRWIVFVQCRNGQLMRPDSQLYIVASSGGVARRMRANTRLMNSWHSFSPNGRWLVFSSKSRSPYTQMYLTHIDEQGIDSPAILIDNATAANRAVNIPEFVNTTADGIEQIDAPAAEVYRVMDEAAALENSREYDAALVKWKQAFALEPDDPRINNGLGADLTMAGDPGAAIPYLQKATELKPYFVDAYYNLGSAMAHEHRLDETIDAWQHAVRIRPSYYQAQEGLAFAYHIKGDCSAALNHARLALDEEPDRVSVLTLAASLMSTCAEPAIVRNGTEAVLLAERARQLTGGKDISVLDTLSAAYAESSRFDEARTTEQQALTLAQRQGDAALIERLKRHLLKFESGSALRCPPDDGTL